MKQSTEKQLAFIFGVVFIVVILVLAIFFPEPTPFQYFAFRTVLALAAAGVGAVLPGLIMVDISHRSQIVQVSIRAAGALALFVVVYFFGPAAISELGVEIPEPQSYLMDANTDRLILITPLSDGTHRIEEPTSPWPWEGVATLEDDQLQGQANFTKSEAEMNVIGTRRWDDSFVVSYKFIKRGDGTINNQVHEHVWYPVDGNYDKYLLDGNVVLGIVVLTHVDNYEYRVENPSSSRPWEGMATLENSLLQGSAKFRNSKAQMKIEGTLQSDGSFDVRYDFTANYAGESTNWTEEHTWVPAK